MILIQSSDPSTKTTSDGYGDCPAFQHSHADTPGSCFTDEDDALILQAPTRHEIDGDPFDKESPEVKAAMASNADIAAKFKRIYKSEDYPYGAYVWPQITLVEGDLQTIQVLTDRSDFVDASKRLADDYGLLDAKDDMLRVSDVI